MALQRAQDLNWGTVSLTATSQVPQAGMNVERFEGFTVTFEFDHSGGGTATGSVKLQTSHTGGLSANVWSDYPESSLSFTNTTTNHQMEVGVRRFRFVRAVITNSTGAGGTVTVKFFGTTIVE